MGWIVILGLVLLAAAGVGLVAGPRGGSAVGESLGETQSSQTDGVKDARNGTAPEVCTDEKGEEQVEPGRDGKGQAESCVSGDVEARQDRSRGRKGRRRRDIDERGGAPRSSGNHGTSVEPIKEGPWRTWLPTFRCVFYDGQWWVTVGVDGLPNVNSSVEVRQRGEVLPLAPGRESWLLTALDSVTVQVEGETHDVALPIAQDRVVVFRLLESGREGILARTLSSGLYGIMAPEPWELVTDAPIPMASDPTAYRGWVVRFVEIPPDFNGLVSLRTASGDDVTIVRSGPAWEFVGEAVPDAHPRMGPLFLGQPPKLRLRRQGHLWAVRAVVGQEGPGPASGSRWRAIVDVQGTGEPEDVIARALESAPPTLRDLGWFFVRLYDEKDDLVESHDFRFARGVTNVTVTHDPWAVGDGAPASSISLRLDAGWNIQPVGGGSGLALRRLDESPGVRVEVEVGPGRAVQDCVPFRIRSPRGGELEWRAPLGRLAWGIAENGGEVGEWTSVPLLLKKDDYNATSRRCLIIRTPPPADCRKAALLLNGDWLGEYAVAAADRTVRIPLNHLFDPVGARPDTYLDLSVSFKPVNRGALVAVIRRRLRCPACSFTAKSHEKFLQHVVDHHTGTYFRPLTYEEIARRHHELPTKIYQCKYCGHYVPADQKSTNPNDAISNHQRKECDQARAASAGGSVKLHFRVVTDASEARQYVEKRLPQEFACAICGEVLSFPFNADPDVRLKGHLRKHRSELSHRLSTHLEDDDG